MEKKLKTRTVDKVNFYFVIPEEMYSDFSKQKITIENQRVEDNELKEKIKFITKYNLIQQHVLQLNMMISYISMNLRKSKLKIFDFKFKL